MLLHPSIDRLTITTPSVPLKHISQHKVEDTCFTFNRQTRHHHSLRPSKTNITTQSGRPQSKVKESDGDEESDRQ
jgi:hypothetical protein